MAKICQRAENEWVGMKSGIMDQMISAAGVEGRALLIDCRSLSLDPVPLPPETLAVIMDTTTRRELVTSAYNERRAQCEEAAKFFNAPALRDVTIQQFEAAKDRLDPVVAKRARHVITENDRTLKAAEAMRVGDATTLGKLMNASHTSLRDDFEVTNDALNQIVLCARQQDGCYGARMTGGGFGGCAVALVSADSVAAFTVGVTACYKEATGLDAHLYVSPASEGASVILPVGG
jgi:galactokinase